MDTKKGAIQLVFTSLLLAIPAQIYSQQQGEININQDFRKQAEGGAEHAANYAPYPFHDESTTDDVEGFNSEVVNSQPLVNPPISSMVVTQQPPETPAFSPTELAEEPAIPSPTSSVSVRPVPELKRVSAPATLYSYGDSFRKKAASSVVAIPLAQKPVVGPLPVPQVQQETKFSEAVTATAKPREPQPNEVRIPTLSSLRGFCWRLSQGQVKYKLGRNHPTFGGLDSSGSVQFSLKEAGLTGVPRTTNGMNNWLREKDALYEFRSRPSVTELAESLEPGNLIFWGDLQSRKLNHVMIYMGFDVQRGHLAFGTRGGTERGINNNEIDIFPLFLDRERIISTGRVPGLIRSQ